MKATDKSRSLFILIGLIVWAVLIVLWQVWLNRLPAESEPVVTETAAFDPNSVVFAGVPRDGIPSIDEPDFETVGMADVYLQDSLEGLAVEADGAWRFYPYQILVWHQVVNDDFGGIPLLVTYCPLCNSGGVFERTLDGETLSFGTTGTVSDNEALIYDRESNSLWSPLRSQAVMGAKAGQELQEHPFAVMTWADFKKNHLSGQVLSRETGADRDYTHNPYGDYLTNNDILFPLSYTDARLRAKTEVIGVPLDGYGAAAVATEFLKEKIATNFSEGGINVTVWFDPTTEATYAFVSSVNGTTYTFSWDGENFLDSETGSQWTLGGRAVSGPARGVELERIPTRPAFWFCWAAIHPETTLYGT